MRQLLYFTGFLTVMAFELQSATVTVNNSGFTFNPAAITISEGDTVIFSLASAHNTIEVSQSTWNANGSTALPGGFSTGFGGGMVTGLTAGTHYYVCQPHAGTGMKGTIIVNPATGLQDVKAPTQDINLFPVPGKNIIYFALPGNPDSDLNLTIYDINGRVWNSDLQPKISPDNKMMINIPGLLPGIYFIRISDGINFNQVERFTVE
ncbi:MAG: T9SS type A sorting domain-containing protein [Bacteroidetes bacterium]|nr:T9SS type A sorting domain-containing protein [Bacteroidota bacterium]